MQQHIRRLRHRMQRHEFPPIVRQRAVELVDRQEVRDEAGDHEFVGVYVVVWGGSCEVGSK